MIPMTVLTIVCGLAVLVSSIILFNAELNDTIEDKVFAAKNMAENTIADMRERARLAAIGMSNNSDMAAAILDGNRGAVMALANNLKTVTHLDYSIIFDAGGYIIARTHEPEMYGDNFGHLPHVASALRGESQSYIIQGQTIVLGASAGAPIFDEFGEIIGAITLGFRMDRQDFAHRLKELTGCEITIFMDAVRVASTVLGEEGDSVVGLELEDRISRQVLSGNIYSNRMEIFGRNALAMYSPLYGAEREVVGILSVGYYTEEDTQKIWMFILNGLLASLAVLTVCIFIARYVSGYIESQLNKMMAEVREADEYIRLMFNAMPCCVLWDSNLRVINCNTEALKFFGVDATDDLEYKVADLSPEFQPDGSPSVEGEREMVKKAFNEGYNRQEWMHRSMDGELLPCEVTLVRVKHGEEYLVATFIRDLREQKALFAEIEEAHDDLRKALESAEVANKAKTSFLANMSHEIRTPMNSIIGFTELAIDDDISPKTRDYLTNILENSVWLLQIINDILDISKVESGKLELENIPFSLPDLFVNCRTMVAQKAEEKGLALYFYAEPSFGKVPLGDPIRLRQILVNLLSNAIKFTSSGIVKLHASVKEVTEKTITMGFVVKDSGIGMTNEQIERVFDSFVQAETGITRKYGGTGLGLTITKSILDIMGGKLAVESTPGVGSKFSFDLTFDVIDVSEADQYEKVTSLEGMEKPGFKGEVLICEDNAMNQQVITEHLARVGLTAVVAENGKVGADKVASRIKNGEKQFDLIFMDMHMPVMDGLEASKLIRDMDESIPIIALTANIMAHDRELYKDNGMVDYVGKPFTSQELWRCLMRFFTPVNWRTEDADQRMHADAALRQKLINNFMLSNRYAWVGITDALGAGDIKTAHRLAHTLSSNAGQLRKTRLQQAAKDVELALGKGTDETTPEKLAVLKDELEAVLLELSPMEGKGREPAISEAAMDAAAVRALLDKLLPLLDKGDPECLSFVAELQRIPGSDPVIDKMESFDFKSAKALLEDWDG